MESLTTPSLSFSMPGRMSATVRGRRGGGQIWLTVRRTGGFFFHLMRSWLELPASGILGVAESRPAGWIGRAFQLGGGRGVPKGTPQVLGRTTRPRGGHRALGPLRSEAHSHRAAPSLQGALKST